MRYGGSQQRQFVVIRAESIPEFLYPRARIHLENSSDRPAPFDGRRRTSNVS